MNAASHVLQLLQGSTGNGQVAGAAGATAFFVGLPCHSYPSWVTSEADQALYRRGWEAARQDALTYQATAASLSRQQEFRSLMDFWFAQGVRDYQDGRRFEDWDAKNVPAGRLAIIRLLWTFGYEIARQEAQEAAVQELSPCESETGNPQNPPGKVGPESATPIEKGNNGSTT